MDFQFNYTLSKIYFKFILFKSVETCMDHFCECLMGTLKNVLIVNMFHKCEADCVK